MVSVGWEFVDRKMLIELNIHFGIIYYKNKQANIYICNVFFYIADRSLKKTNIMYGLDLFKMVSNG